jgi:hypothetical protein
MNINLCLCNVYYIMAFLFVVLLLSQTKNVPCYTNTHPFSLNLSYPAQLELDLHQEVILTHSNHKFIEPVYIEQNWNHDI